MNRDRKFLRTLTLFRLFQGARTSYFLRWLLFTVFVTVSPLFFNYLLSSIWSQHPGLLDILNNGELYLVSTALAATSVGDLFYALRESRDDQVSARMFALFAGICVIGLSILFYATLRSYTFLKPALAGLQKSDVNINQSLLFNSSWLAFLGSLAVGVYANLTGAEPAKSHDQEVRGAA